VTQSSSVAPHPQPVSPISVSLSGDAMLAVPVVAWLVWNKLLQPTFADRLGSFLVPVKEERRLQTLIAQIGGVTRASRVVLCGFHNGALDSDGYHLQKISTLSAYVREGCSGMTKPINNLPLTKIAVELEQMMKAGDWVTVSYREDLPGPCRDHLLRNDIAHMSNRLIKAGNVPIGILSLHYNSDYNFDEDITRESYAGLLEDLYDQIVMLLRHRLLHPNPVKKIANQIFGTLRV
jgi:hypothetical protein